MVVLFWVNACRDRQVDFNAEVRPILNKHCLACHGGVKRSGGLSLLFREEALQVGESGQPAIVPGSPGSSELMRRVRHHDPELRMPLDAAPLSADQIGLLERWIAQGAIWEAHWAYVAPQPQPVPATGSDWAANDIDHFVLDRLRTADLQPAGPADRATLLRRVSLDLTGLPPTPAQVRAFEADSAPDAYERRVDSLLASPRYGERWTAMWLDLARFADSKGYEKDPHRDIWPYRDWLIRAFNADMPFDQFTIAQLAGDLLPEPDRDLLVATAFHRNTMTNTEGGTENEEFRVAAVIDRVNTTWTVWQGTTMECVQCHSHPYDPFRQTDYYRSLAYFNNSADADLSTDPPFLEWYSAPDSQAVAGLLDWLGRRLPIDTAAPLRSRLRQALHPRLWPPDMDDFQSVTLYDDGALANWTNNLQTIHDKTFHFAFDRIDLSGVRSLSYWYAATGDAARLELRLDSLTGAPVQVVEFAATGNIRGNEGGGGEVWRELRVPMAARQGVHDLLFTLVNTRKQVPEGIVVLKEIRLDGPMPPGREVLAMQDSLMRLRLRAQRLPVMRERGPVFARVTRRFERGNWLTPADTVAPGVPATLPPLPADAPPHRLALARWLVSRDNPLTARVLVNRLWAQLFGTGLVETSEDFGTQGTPPSHPELLDYLAMRLMHDHAWQLKPLLRDLVTSATYRQASQASATSLTADPYNRLLSRGPRFRLSAEQIRDQALAVSGLLSDKIGGPSVMPPQPEGVWKVVYSGRQWLMSQGEDRYRRAIYTYVRRTSPYPSALTFDAPSRELCVARRIRTNTPLQALVTLNDPVYVEAAQALARQAVRMADTPDAQIAAVYTQTLLRTPSDSTRQVLAGLYAEATQTYARDPAQAAALLGDDASPPLAALTVVAQVVLNLDAFLVKE
ncbi:MAG: hypothetical protein OHK0039_35300 [Bacteroidia bacterium]